MDVVTADGNVRTISQDNDPHLMRAARVNLGALGSFTASHQCVKPSYAVDESGHERRSTHQEPGGGARVRRSLLGAVRQDVLVKKWHCVPGYPTSMPRHAGTIS